MVLTISQPVECLCPVRAELAEGPVWHAEAWWWVDIVVGTLNRYDQTTRLLTTRATGDFVSAAVPTSESTWWLIAQRHGVSLLNWATGEIRPYAKRSPVDSDQRFNDGKCDPAGRFIVGSLDLAGRAQGCAVFRCGTAGAPLETLFEAVSLSNGLAWSSDGRRFYHIDTLTRSLSVYPYDTATGEIGTGSILAKFETSDGYPDGITLDTEHGLWIAMWGAGQVLRLDSDSGQITHRLPVSIAQPSSVCFGGPRLDQLLITSAWQGYDANRRASEPEAGNIFVCKPGFTGFPVTPFHLNPTHLQ